MFGRSQFFVVLAVLACLLAETFAAQLRADAAAEIVDAARALDDNERGRTSAIIGGSVGAGVFVVLSCCGARRYFRNRELDSAVEAAGEAGAKVVVKE